MNPIKRIYNRLPVSTRSTIRSLVPDNLLRWYAFKNTDVFLISYPKSGRTWLRLMIGKAVIQQYNLPESEENLLIQWKIKPHPEVPMIRVVHDDRPMLRSPSELEANKNRYRGKRVIFLARDPRDVVISSYFETNKRAKLFGDNPYENRKPDFDGSLTEFIHREEGGFRTILRYYNIWAENRDQPQGFLLVRYEDMISGPEVELMRVLDFLGLNHISKEILAEAVKFASFENMRKMESMGKFQSGILRPADHSDPDSYKTRQGKVQGYLDYMDKAEIEYVNHQIREYLSPIFGYTA